MCVLVLFRIKSGELYDATFELARSFKQLFQAIFEHASGQLFRSKFVKLFQATFEQRACTLQALARAGSVIRTTVDPMRGRE